MPATRRPFVTESSLKGPRAMEILDEAISLIRRAPLSLLSLYYLGALPFCLALVYFYFDMTQGAYAEAHLPGEALLLTGLYFWMKTCQAVFARKLLVLLEWEDQEPWNLPRWTNTALLQVIYGGTLAIIYPLALLITIPFGWVNAFYHNISIVATSSKSTVRSSFLEAAELSRLWPKQNHLILGIMLAALLVLFLNLAVFFFMVPSLLNMFFGLLTVFDENGSAWNNSSFYLDVLVFCFLILNPFNKAVYVLRCFYGRSRLSGADLKAELHRQNKIRQEQPSLGGGLLAAMILSFAFLALPVRADNAAPPPSGPVSVTASPTSGTAKLDQAIEKTLQKDEFAWRLPHPEADTQDDGIIARTIQKFLKYLNEKIFEPLGKLLQRFFDWLFGSERKPDMSSDGWTLLGSIPWRMVFITVLVAVVGCLLLLFFRHFRRRRVHPTATLATLPVRTVDLEAEDVRADELPEDSWLALAQQLIERGELRLALRAFYLATLSVLAQGQLVRLGAAKSNRDYLLELTRRLRGNVEAVQPFRQNINLFEASWYGTHAVTVSIIETMRANHQQVRIHATP